MKKRRQITQRQHRKNSSLKKGIIPFMLSLTVIVVIVGLLPLSKVVFGQSVPSVTSHGPLDTFEGHPPFHIKRHQTSAPVGLSPHQLNTVYNLPGSGGTGTIAIIDAFDDPTAQSDLNTFSSTFGLPALPSCTSAGQSTCFEKHKMAGRVRTDSGWALEESLDTQWAHAIAPSAHVLLVEAKSASGNDLLSAINYARNRSDVVAVSMSWGGSEFSGESSYDSYFTSPYNATFFASSGDSGTGVQWPAVSSKVTGVGGTTLSFSNGQLSSETAWSGSGGGLSQYELAPTYQTAYNVPQANGFRAVPDVSFDADPSSGVAVFDSTAYQGVTGWFQVGGTSLGAPSWAAIRSLGGTTTSNQNFYQDAATVTYSNFFRDITSGTNGSCGFYCTATTKYDYVTGVGSPLTFSY